MDTQHLSTEGARARTEQVARSSYGRLLVVLDELDALAACHDTASAMATFQPYHAARADLLARAGDTTAASQSFTTAADLAADRGLREYLLNPARG